jgi:hypothetical protein
VLSRDDLTIITIIPWADQWTEETVKRAWWWSDDILVGMDVWREIDAHDVGLATFSAESQQAMNTLWTLAKVSYEPDGDTYFCILHSGEVFADWASIRPAIRRHHGQRIGAMAYQMWDREGNYRTDWLPPQMVFPFFPYRPDTLFDAPAQYVHRGPSGIHNVPTVGHPVADLLSYRYATTETRHYWHGVYWQSDWPHHRQWAAPILKPAQTKPWEKGGLL